MRYPRLLLATSLFLVPLTLAARARSQPSAPRVKYEVSKDLPKKAAERLKLGIEAVTEDRPKGDYKAARKKLEHAMDLCKKDRECPDSDRAHIELMLGVVLADSGAKDQAELAFERALKLLPTIELGDLLWSPAAAQAFAIAQGKIAPTVAPAPAAPKPTQPADAGLQPPAGDDAVKPLNSIAGAEWTPGVGFVQGGAQTEPAVAAEGTSKKLQVPGFDQSTWFDSVMEEGHFRFALALPFDHYDFTWAAPTSETLGGLGMDLRLGYEWILHDVFIPYIDLDVGFGKAGNKPNLWLLSGGDYEMWRVSGDTRGGFELDLSWFSLGGFGGAFWTHYAPSIENLPNEPSAGGSDFGPQFGGRAHIGSGIFLALEYVWRVGRANTARIRRLELGGRGDERGDFEWALFWEEREQPTVGLAATASQEARVLQAFPIERSLGIVFRNY